MRLTVRAKFALIAAPILWIYYGVTTPAFLRADPSQKSIHTENKHLAIKSGASDTAPVTLEELARISNTDQSTALQILKASIGCAAQTMSPNHDLFVIILSSPPWGHRRGHHPLRGLDTNLVNELSKIKPVKSWDSFGSEQSPNFYGLNIYIHPLDHKPTAEADRAVVDVIYMAAFSANGIDHRTGKNVRYVLNKKQGKWRVVEESVKGQILD